MKKTKKLALAAILSALGVVVLLLGSIITVLDLTAVALASILIMLAVIEIRGAYPYLIWLVTGVLSMLLLPDKFGALVYLVFGGIYPIFKAMYERLHPALSWILKFGTFNAMLAIMILIASYVMGLTETGLAFTLPVFALCNFTFFIYDIATTHLVTLYLVKLRKTLGLKNFLK